MDSETRQRGRPRRSIPTEDDQNSTRTAGLTERQREILRIIIQEYTLTAAPVGSETIVQKYRLPLSSATVRNEMAELEREGFISHPHTSAGRVPLDKGYRYFVENLMERNTALSVVEQHTIEHQFYQLQREIDEWLQLAASVLARTSNNAAVVTAPQSQVISETRLKHVQLIGVQERVALCIIVTGDSTIKEQLLILDSPITHDELTALSARLNARFANQTARTISSVLNAGVEGFETPPQGLNQPISAAEIENTAARRIVELLRSLDLRPDAQIYRDGLLYILEQPEFSDVARVRQIIEIIERGAGLTAVIPQILSGEGTAVQVIIGGENRYNELRLLSLVLARYGVEGESSGVVGVVGPTRMEYGRSISTVQYVARVLSQLMNDRKS